MRQFGKKNIVDSDWPEMTVWRMRIACWITKPTNAHSEYVILIAFPLQKLLRERANVYKNGLYFVWDFRLSPYGEVCAILGCYATYICS